MRLMIDGTSLLLRSAGVKTHIYYWIENLRRAAGVHQLSVFPYIHSWRELDDDRSQMGSLSTQARLALVRFSNRVESDVLNFAARGQDLFHVSQHLTHPSTRTRLTATFHDATCWLLPDTHTPQNIAATKAYVKCVLEKADGIIAVSEATRTDAIRILGLREDKIHCIYHSVPDAYSILIRQPLRIHSRNISSKNLICSMSVQ
jgi:hypothetical protein